MKLLSCYDCHKETKDLYYYDGDTAEIFCLNCIGVEILKVDPKWYEEMQKEEAEWDE